MLDHASKPITIYDIFLNPAQTFLQVLKSKNLTTLLYYHRKLGTSSYNTHLIPSCTGIHVVQSHGSLFKEDYALGLLAVFKIVLL